MSISMPTTTTGGRCVAHDQAGTPLPRCTRRSKASFDMAQAWDARCRKWFGDRYDARHNLVRFMF